MYNWNTDEKKFKKLDPVAYKRWKLVQLINYGVDEGKLSRREIIKEWPHIKDQLFPDNQKALEFFLWGKPWKKEPGLRLDRMNWLKWLIAKKHAELNSVPLEEFLEKYPNCYR